MSTLTLSMLVLAPAVAVAAFLIWLNEKNPR